MVELQNKPLLAAPDDFQGLDNTNLCFLVAKLSSLAKYNKLTLEQSGKSEELDVEGDEGIGGSSDEEEHDVMEAEDDEDLHTNGSGDNEEPGEDETTDEEDLCKIPKAFEDTGLNCEFGDDSDDEEDNFDELIAPEGKESDEDDDNIKFVENDDVKKAETSKKFGKTMVDSKFFNLRESEWVADNDAIGKNYVLESEDIDLMADVSDGSEEEVDIFIIHAICLFQSRMVHVDFPPKIFSYLIKILFIVALLIQSQLLSQVSIPRQECANL